MVEMAFVSRGWGDRMGERWLLSICVLPAGHFPQPVWKSGCGLSASRIHPALLNQNRSGGWLGLWKRTKVKKGKNRPRV